MDFITGVKPEKTIKVEEMKSMVGKTVKINGAIHTIRNMGEVAFVILRKSSGLVQCVYEEGKTKFDLKDLKEESAIEVEGIIVEEERAPYGLEIRMEKIIVLSEPADVLPLAINKWKMNTSLETKLSLRPIALRNIRERAKFKIQEGIVRGFRDYLISQDFTEVRTCLLYIHLKSAHFMRWMIQ